MQIKWEPPSHEIHKRIRDHVKTCKSWPLVHLNHPSADTNSCRTTVISLLRDEKAEEGVGAAGGGGGGGKIQPDYCTITVKG